MSDLQMILNRMKMKIDELRLTRLEREELEDYLNFIVLAVQRMANENEGLKNSLREVEAELKKESEAKKGGG
jgi:cell division septum initiation protein DivIVA